jgi:TRAP-type C4-dicarboxylate transport system permease small subunit
MARFDALYGRLLGVFAAIAAVLVLGMAGAITTDVVLRNLALGGVVAADELSEYALYLITVLTAPWLLRQGQHVRIDALVTALPPMLAWRLELAADALGIAVSAALVRTGWVVAAESARLGAVTIKTLSFPEWWLYAPLPAGFALLGLEFALRLRRIALAPGSVRADARSAG